MDKIKSLYNKYKEIILYLVFGVLTTVINYVVYFALTFLGVNIYIANVIAWICAVLFAYFTNRGMVFNSQAKGRKSILKEMLAFYGGRVFSLAVEEILLFVCVSLLNMNEYIIKLILQVVVVVLNYILSKFFVFRKKKD